MAKSLGIFVTNPDNMKHVMGIAKAAKAKVEIKNGISCMLH